MQKQYKTHFIYYTMHRILDMTFAMVMLFFCNFYYTKRWTICNSKYGTSKHNKYQYKTIRVHSLNILYISVNEIPKCIRRGTTINCYASDKVILSYSLSFRRTQKGKRLIMGTIWIIQLFQRNIYMFVQGFSGIR